MAKKSPHTKKEPFSLEVSNLIRHHTGEIASLMSKRKTAFEDRDHLEGQIAKAEQAGQQAVDVKAKHSDQIRLIDQLQADIKWHRDELQRVAEEADNPQLEVLYERPPEPPPLEPKAPSADVPGQLRLAGTDGKAEKPAVPAAAGVDEHLKATVAELQLEKTLTEKLIAQGFTTIGALAKAIDAEGDLLGHGLSGPQSSKVVKAVGSFRAEHRKAMRAAEGE